MVVHDRSRVVLRCVRCGGWFGVPPACQLRLMGKVIVCRSSRVDNMASIVGNQFLKLSPNDAEKHDLAEYLESL